MFKLLILVNMNTIAQKIALITGVSRESGLGFETARQLAQQGWKVIITAREQSKVAYLAELLTKEELNVVPYELDILNDESADMAARFIMDTHGRLDALINNAGAFYDQGNTPLKTKASLVREAFDTNLLGAWRMIQHLLPCLKNAENANIVNVSSGAGSYTDESFGIVAQQSNIPVYSLTKLALNGLTIKFAAELKETGIKINAVCPGFVATYPGTEEWGARPIADGAKGIVWAATLPENGPSGGFFRDGKAISW